MRQSDRHGEATSRSPFPQSGSEVLGTALPEVRVGIPTLVNEF